jgi:hypothetical protein
MCKRRSGRISSVQAIPKVLLAHFGLLGKVNRSDPSLDVKLLIPSTYGKNRILSTMPSLTLKSHAAFMLKSRSSKAIEILWVNLRDRQRALLI